MVRKIKKFKQTPADELKNVYELFIEVMENPYRAGYQALIKKIGFNNKTQLNLRLFDKKDYIDYRIKEITKEILNIIGFT